MYIFQTEFYKYSPSYFDEVSILENEVLNESYLIKTKELLTKAKNYYGQLLLGFYKNKWYPLILPMNVKNENDLDRKKRKEAELLIENDLPTNHILGYICYNEKAKSKLVHFGIEEKKIVVIPNYYFSV